MAGPLLSVAEAWELVSSAVDGPLESELVELDEALGRVLAQDVAATADVPRSAVSAMDGYALGVAGEPRRYRIVGESRAGHPFTGSLAVDEAVRISTGAAVPGRAEAVVRQEDTAVQDGVVTTTVAVAPANNIRAAGEDMRAGDSVLKAGLRLGPVELAAAVTAGIGGELAVARRPRVSILSTGDELRAPGEPLSAGAVHNSNGPMLRGLVRRAGASVELSSHVEDEAGATERAIAQALEVCDVLILTGGVSVGPHDHVRPALARLGVEQRFWRVALQPGKPTWFGARGRQLVFGLPGNPVSTAVTFALFVRPALRALQGERPAEAVLESARLGEPVQRNRDRAQCIRVRLRVTADGTIAVPTGPQGSHLISSMVEAGALAVIPAGTGVLAAGESVEIRSLDG